MKIIPKYYSGGIANSDWYYKLWKDLSLPGLINSKKYNNPNLKDRYTGISLNNAMMGNLAYTALDNYNIRLGDISNYFSIKEKYTDLDKALAAYNSDIDILDNTFSPGKFNYDPTKFDATLHNTTFKNVYNHRALNGEELYKTGWDDNQIKQGGSNTWQRRAVKYDTKFEDDLINDLKSARARVYDTPYGKAYVDETGRLKPLTEDLLKKLLIFTTPSEVEPYPKMPPLDENSPEYQIRSDIIKDHLELNPDILEGINNGSYVPREDKKTNKLKDLLKLKIDPELSQMLLSAARVAIDNAINKKATDEYLSHLNPPLQSPWEAYRMVHGDYIAKQNAELQAARLRSTASRPFTADADRQMAYQLEAVDKGNQAILAGLQKDADTFYRTSEAATNLAILNILNRTNTANLNRQLLSQYDEMRARIKRDLKLQNMQNWDDWGAFWLDRALKKHDLNQEREYAKLVEAEEKKKQLNDTFASLSDLRGIDTSKVDNALKIMQFSLYGSELYNKAALDYKKYSELNQYLRLYNQGLRQGADVSALKDYLSKYVTFNKDNTFTYLKNGGILRKLLQGGGFPLVRWTPLMGAPYQQYLNGWEKYLGQTTASSRSLRSSRASDSEKEESSLLKSMVETLKGGDLLPADMDIISGQLRKFFDILRYTPEGTSVDNIYRGYIDILSYVNRAKYSANTMKEAKAHLDSNKALNSYAVDLDGAVYIGKVGTLEIGKVSPTLALEILLGKNPEYRVLTNSDLLEVRSLIPGYAFNDGLITTSATSATSMEAISKYIKDFIGKLGSDKLSRDLFTRDFGNTAELGLLVLNDLKNRRFSEEERAYLYLALSGTGSVNALLESNITTESQISQAKAALSALSSSLPTNMKTLLYLLGKGEEGASELLTNLVLQGTSSSFKLGINDITPFNNDGTLGSSSKTGKGKESGEESTSRFLEDFQKGWGASDGIFTLNPGNQLELTIPSKDYNPIEAASPSSLKDALINSKLWGIGKDNNSKIYFGDLKIPTERLNEVVYTGEGFSRVILPISLDGSPRFALFNEVQKILQENNANLNDLYEGNLSKELTKKIVEAFNRKGLRDLVSGNNPDLSKFGVFAITRGLASSKVGISDQNKFAYRLKNPDYEWYSNILSTKGLDNKVLKYELNEKSFWNPYEWDIFGGSYDKIYEGTIYIPISLNPEMAAIAEGNKEKPSTAKRKELENQAWNSLLRYSTAPSIDVLQ